jgi:hypothetical protein
MSLPLRLVVFVVLALFVIGCVTHLVHGPVARGRLERFARRQSLQITVANGDQIIEYLAITRRWRAAGIATGILVSTAWTLANEGFRIGFVVLFSGWFAGALVAEGRATSGAPGPRRVASLVPRRPSAYLPRTAWWLMPVAAVVAVAVGVSTTVAAALGRADPDWTAVFWVIVALALAVLIRAIQLRVLRRPQPPAQSDVTAADDAIRSRSLHVLAGGGAALVLYCVSAQLGAINPPSATARDAITACQTIGVFAIPALGWIAATATWRVRRYDGAAPTPDAAAAEVT